MQVSVETTEGLGRRMTVEVPEERIDTELQKRLQNIARTTNIKGFRPGKVPMKVVKQKYGSQVRMEVVGEIMQSSFYEAVQQENLQPAGMPQIEPKNIESGSNLEFVATFEVMPEVEPASLEGVSVEKLVAEISDEDLDKMLQTLCKQRTEWKAVERGAENDDRINIDFTGTLAGVAFEGGSAQEFPLVLGGKRMIDGFEEGLLGKKAGEEFTLELKFPEDYGQENLAGKDVQFAIKVNKVEAPEVPELNEELAKSFGVADGSVEALRKEVRENMEREMKARIAANNKQAVMDRIYEINELEIPQALIEQESRAMVEQMRAQMHIPAGKQEPNLDPSLFSEQAKRRVALGLILSKLVHTNDLKVEADTLKSKVEEIAASYEKPEEVVKWYYGDRSRLAEVESLVLEDCVVDWVLDNVKVEEKKVNFDEIMNQSQG